MLLVDSLMQERERHLAMIAALNNQIGSLIEVIASRDKKHQAEKDAVKRAAQQENELLADEIRQQHMLNGEPAGYTANIACETDSMPAVIEVDGMKLRMLTAIYAWEE